MASPPKPWKLEYAKSSRSTCKTCKNTIDKDSFRIAKMIPATQFDGFMPVWHHASCIMKKKGQFRNIEDVEGIDNLRWEDQQKIRKYILEAGESATPEGDGENDECAIEYAKSGRATCKGCGEKIAKGEIRISTMVESDNPRFRSKVPVWRHAKCFLPLSIWRSEMESMPGWDNLSEEDKEIVRGLAKPYVKEVKKDGDSGKGESRKRKSKDDETLVNEKAKKQNSEGKSNISDKNDLDKVLESQSKALWKIKDELQKNVSTSEMREMLEVNDQISSGSEYNLKERCADGMLFGPLGKCPKCSGLLEYSDSQYKCQGYLTAWSKCTYATTSPERLKGKWKIPEDTENEYLKKWFKTQKVKKPSRVFPVQASAKSAGNDSAMGSTDSTFLSGLKVVLAGKLKRSPPDWTSQLEAAGGKMLKNLTRGIDCLIVSESDDESNNADVEKALNMKIPVVRESYILDCLEKKKRLSVRRYQTEEASKAEVVKVKVKGRSSVHEESGLQETGHILEDGKSIYNTTLNMSDLSTGINSYYILQIIEDDKKAVYHVFRKWGRVGNSRIGGQKLERMPKSEAKAHFERLFFEKTGNEWNDWINKENIQKHPGKFYPLEIDYGVDESQQNEKVPLGAKSKLHPRVIELLKLLFDLETYREAMREFEINMSEMPLGKLSKTNIQKGFEILTELQNLIQSNENVDQNDGLIIDASNRFFTLIPTIHPHLIRDEEEIKLKIQMLEALRDIEIASSLMNLQEEGDDEDPLDANYKKLHCDISPLPHDSPDYQLVKKYLENTHASTHKDWKLELEDVFAIDREGETDEYNRNIDNKMLLWHGSRITNYVGILSQGLRIAPPEAPVTGYMFGKGIYFADLVSKSAQYCFTQRNSPVGLMLLSEVALGDIYERKKAEYMDKPPEGKHSTKGLGKNKPNEEEFEKWRDDVTVPCGHPVPSGVRNSELMYNEYIVYDKAQVKLQFLLKVRFHHKR